MKIRSAVRAAATACLVSSFLILSLSTVALSLSSDAFAQAENTAVTTPAGATHGELANGNLPKAIAPDQLTDSGIAASSVATATNTQTLQNKSISGAQNTLSSIPTAALAAPQGNGAKVQLSTGTTVTGDLLDYDSGGNAIDSSRALSNTPSLAANTFSGLQSLLAGVALPSPSNPTGSNLYVDSNGNLHFVSPFMDAQLCGAKFSGDASRCWLPSFGSGATETSSGQQPNFQINRNDKFNGGSGIQFAEHSIYTNGNGSSSPTTAAFASGTSIVTISPNGNFSTGQPAYGACIPSGTTVASYSSGTLGLSNPLACNISQGTQISTTIGSTGISPTNQPIGIQSDLNQYTNQTSTVAAPNALNGFLFKWVPSTSISEASNIICRDWTGRKSSVAGPCIAAEEDVVPAGPDDNQDRYILELTGAEGEPSADGPTDIFAGIRIRPQSAESQASPNSVTFDNGILLTTMPGGAANGVYGSFLHGFNCGGGETIGCHDAVSDSLTHMTGALAAAGQNQIQFALPTSINAGEGVSGNAGIPNGTTVSAVYQCDAVYRLAGCGAATNATLVVLSNNLTSSIAPSAPITFTGTFTDGSNFNGIFSDAFANWLNQLNGGVIKAGTLLNTNGTTALDICSQGEDSAATEVCYSDIKTTIANNTHGSAAGTVNIVAAASGQVQANGVQIADLSSPQTITNKTITVSGDLTTQRHTVSSGTNLSSGSVAFGAGGGTGATLNSITGDDRHFNINFTTGTSPTASSAIFTVTFTNAYGAAPQCVFSPAGGNTALAITRFYVTSTTTTVVMNDNSTALSATVTYNLNVQCIQ